MIRRKLVHGTEISPIDAKTSVEPHAEDFAGFTVMVETLRSRNQVLEEALVHADEDAKDVNIKNNETVSNLHSKLDHLESKIYSLENMLTARDCKIVELDKELKVKDEIIQTINKGFNQKVSDLKN